MTKEAKAIKESKRNQKERAAAEKEENALVAAKLKHFRNSLGHSIEAMASLLGLDELELQWIEDGTIPFDMLIGQRYFKVGFNLNSIGDNDLEPLRPSTPYEKIFDAMGVINDCSDELHTCSPEVLIINLLDLFEGLSNFVEGNFKENAGLDLLSNVFEDYISKNGDTEGYRKKVFARYSQLTKLLFEVYSSKEIISQFRETLVKTEKVFI